MIDDAGIKEALHHWTPRFLASGIDYNDLQRIIARMKTWNDWCRARSSHRRVRADCRILRAAPVERDVGFSPCRFAIRFRRGE